MPESYEIRLIINHTETGYAAKWIDSGGQESDSFPLTLPLDKDDAEQLRWYLEEYYQFPGAGDHVKAQKVEAKLKEWGQALFNAAFGTAQGTNVYRNLMDAIERDGMQGLITLGATDPDVLVQPWEMMRDSRGVLALRGVTQRRQLQGAKPSAHFNYALPLRVLLIVSRPTDVGFIDPRNSLLPVLDACDQLGGQVEVEFCDPPTMERLNEMISDAREVKRPYHIIHFDGHGTYLPKTGVGALVFEDEKSKTDLVTGTRFGDLIARLDVPLVLLEACRGASLSDRPVFGSLAPALLESGVGSVVAFSHSVHIQAARILVECFYKKLVGGLSVGAALQEARSAMKVTPKRFLHLGPDAECVEIQDWFIPQLYQVGADPVLLQAGSPLPNLGEGSGVRVFPLPGFPPEPMYHFHGRALELLEIERAFRKYNAVVVSGMGGMGKTALAREAAAWWRRIGRFDQAVFISFERKAGAMNAVQLIGQALEGDNFSSRLDNDTAEGQWQTAVRLFHEQRALVVWDNFESTLPIYQTPSPKSPAPGDLGEGRGGGDELTTFTPEARAQLHALYQDMTAGKPASRLLVTCRPQETGLPGIKEYELAGLKRPDSLGMLAAALDVKGIKTERAGYERHEMDKLLDLLADHPLSVELIAPHLKELTPAEIRADFGGLLEKFANPDAREDRNKGLRASLEFSRRRLSQAAQAILPWLAWFEGGVFERFLIDFANLTPDAWHPIRTELEATALLKLETLEGFNTPYLRFHPTLGYAARPDEVPDPAAAAQGFINVYIGVMGLADDLLRGQQPAAGMALMAHEEANFRRALQSAFARGLRSEMQSLASTLRDYLERAGRNRERDALTAWVRLHLPDDLLDDAACNAIRDHSMTLLSQGQAQAAVQMVQTLLARLLSAGLADGSDPAFQIALAYRRLAMIFVNANRPDLALEPAHAAVARFEQLEKDFRSLKDFGNLETVRGDLSAVLGDLANAYTDLGKFDQALEAAERALAIDRGLKHDQAVATGLGQIATILAAAHRYTEAEARYVEAMQAAQAAGDLELQGITLTHQASLLDNQGKQDRAVDLYKQAITLFQHAIQPQNEMMTCDLLATAELRRGELEAAEAWYKRARQLAGQLQNRAQLATTAQNLGILYQKRAAALAPDDPSRRLWLDQAVASVQEGLEIWLATDNQVNVAASYSQLGILQRMRGDLDAAEQNALKALQIRESLDHPDVWRVYYTLADIARLRGDEKSAAAWQAKYETKRAEIKRREQGVGADGVHPAPRIDEQLIKFLTELAQACYAVRAQKAALPPELAEALAQLHDAQPPFNEIGAFLQAAASGGALLPVPSGLPKQVSPVLEALKEAIEEIK
jgi:tetratricopeptide (TPR) repeat protein